MQGAAQSGDRLELLQAPISVSEADFLAALQPVHQDAWPVQQQELVRHSSACTVLRVGDEGRVRDLSRAVAQQLPQDGAVCPPSFFQWAKSLNTIFG